MNADNDNRQRPAHRTMAERLADLPEYCWALNPTDSTPILIRKGQRGYWPAPRDVDVDALNRRVKVTPAQREAMLYGSVFGFDAPIADPLQHELAT